MNVKSHSRLSDFLIFTAFGCIRWHRGALCRSEASDIVQQTLLEAHQNQPTLVTMLRGWQHGCDRSCPTTYGTPCDARTRQKRDARRVVSLESPSESEARLAVCLSRTGETPSHRMVRCEELVQLADCLLQLPLPQREAITFTICRSGHWRRSPLSLTFGGGCCRSVASRVATAEKVDGIAGFRK